MALSHTCLTPRMRNAFLNLNTTMIVKFENKKMLAQLDGRRVKLIRIAEPDGGVIECTMGSHQMNDMPKNSFGIVKEALPGGAGSSGSAAEAPTIFSVSDSDEISTNSRPLPDWT